MVEINKLLNADTNRVAVCFSGELRSLDITFPLVQLYLLDNLPNFDLFYYGWQDDPDIHKLSLFESHPRCKNILIESRKFLNEDAFYDKPKRKEVSLQGMLRQLHCLKMANSLKTKEEKKNNFIYDYVIRIRPDMFIINDAALNINSMDSDSFYTSNHDDWHGYNDRFYLSNSKNMDIISNRLDMLQWYADLGGILHYETFLKFIIEYNEISVKRVGLQFCLLRTDGTMSGELESIRKGDIMWVPTPEGRVLKFNH